jgi:hypothetical protein
MKQKLITHFLGFFLFIFLAVSSLFVTMFISYRSYSDRIEKVRLQIKVGMHRNEIEKVLGKPDDEHLCDIPGTYAYWSPYQRFHGFLELFRLVKYEDYSNLNIELSRTGTVVKSF